MKRTPNTDSEDRRPTLCPERAFVVQLETAAGRNAAPLAGRVEHVPTGEAARFRSVRQLARFMGRFDSGRSRSDVGKIQRVLVGALLLAVTAQSGQAQTVDRTAEFDSYRRMDWTGQGTFHRLGLFREEQNAVDQYESAAAAPETAEGATPPAGQPTLQQWIKTHLSPEGHANSMFFHSSNIFNTQTGEIEQSQYAEFLGAGVDLDLEPVKLATTFDESLFWFDKSKDKDFDVRTVRQGLSYSRQLLATMALTLTPSWQYSELHNRRSGKLFLSQWTYGLNDQINWFAAESIIGTFSYDFGFQDAYAPGVAVSNKHKHDFNAGLTLIPLERQKLYVSPSVQLSYEGYTRGSRHDEAVTPTVAITFEPYSFLSLNAVESYTGSFSSARGADFHAWASTLFVRLSYRL